MPHLFPTQRRADGPSPSSWRWRGTGAAALLASCCIPSVAAFAQACPPAPSYPLATTLATIKVGDYWIYEQAGTLTLAPGAALPAAPAGGPPGTAPSGGPIPLSGTFVETVETRNFQGQPTMALVVKQNLTIGGNSIYGNNPAPAQIFYVEQDPTTNDLLVIGDNAGPGGTDEAASSPQEFYPGSWSTSAAYNNVLAFPSGNQTGVYLNVTGTQVVHTRIGDFDSWVAPNGATLPATGAVLDTGIDYWTPQLGAPVAFTTVTNLPDGSVRNLSATLIKTSKAPSLYPVVADNLNHPRGLTYNYGALWLTEAGVGGSGPCFAGVGGQNCFGNSGRVSVVKFGQDYTIDDKLGSLATPLIDSAVGPSGITFANGRPLVVVGAGAPQSAISQLGAQQSQVGVLQTFGFGPGGVQAQTVANMANYEFVNNPDNRPLPDGTVAPDSNPFGLTSIGPNAYVADGAAHTATKVTPKGAISVVGIMPPQMVPQPGSTTGATMVEDSVPTGIMPAPYGGGVLVADYTGYPYVPGTANIWKMQEGQDPKVFASGFTNLIGLSPAPNGGVYALEMTDQGALSPDVGGSLIYLSPQGDQKVLACQGLIQPTGIATAPNGDVYVSNYGLNPGYGQVVRVLSGQKSP